MNKLMKNRPNFMDVMADSSALLKAYGQINYNISKSSLTEEEVMVIFQTVNVENNATYCMAFYSYLAEKANVNKILMKQLFGGEPLYIKKLQSLKDFVLSVIRNNANISEKEVAAFYEAGYNKQQLLEVILVLSHRMIGNFVNKIANTPIDEEYAPYITRQV